jgi:2-methylisocitrate lyase-like PEP mutase family enzyme
LFELVSMTLTRQKRMRSMTNVRATLRSLINAGPFVAADCYSALTARVIEHVGFSAGYMGGHATGMMHYAIPDNGSLTPTEMIEQAARVAEAVSIPIIADADQAGESVADVYRSIKRYERAGVAGIHMEDEQTPKHSPFDGPLLSVADMQARIGAAADARNDPDFLIIARCDEFYAEGGGGTASLAEAIRRGVAYAAAGADVFLPTMASPEDVLKIAADVPIPIAAYGKLTDGLAFSLFTGWGTASAARAHYEWATHLRDHGDVPPEAFGFPDKDAIIGQGLYDGVITKWAKATGRPVR